MKQTYISCWTLGSYSSLIERLELNPTNLDLPKSKILHQWWHKMKRRQDKRLSFEHNFWMKLKTFIFQLVIYKILLYRDYIV